MLLELVRSPDDQVHAIRRGTKYWTMCGRTASVRRRWHAEPMEFSVAARACALCVDAWAQEERGTLETAVPGRF